MKVKDTVCGMTAEDKDAAATSDYQGKTYYFCSTSKKCLKWKCTNNVCDEASSLGAQEMRSLSQ